MKAAQAPVEPQFRPVKLVLETQAEVDAIMAVLNNSHVARALGFPPNSYELLNSYSTLATYKLHYALVDIMNPLH